MKNFYEIKGDITEIHIKKYGLVTVIDTDDLEKVLNIGHVNWVVCLDKKRGANTAYVNGCINKVVYRLHRLVSNCPEGMVPDHINHNTLDNRKCNLQIITPTENVKKQSKVAQDWHIGLNKQLANEKSVVLREKDIVFKPNKRVGDKSKVEVKKERIWNDQKEKFELIYRYKII